MVLKKEIAEATAAMEAAKELDRFEEAGALQHKVRAPLQCSADHPSGLELQPSHGELFSACDAASAPSLATIPRRFPMVRSSVHGLRPPSGH